MRIAISIFLIATCFSFHQSFSQTRADSISLVFPKLLIINDRQQTLLAFDANRKAYEVPAFGVMQGPVDFEQYISAAAGKIGIGYDSYRLGGLFTYIFPTQYRTYIRPYFVIQCTGYPGRTMLADSSYQWVSFEEAARLIPYPASAKIVEKVLSFPKQVWAATFEEYGYTDPVDPRRIVSRTILDFYKIN